MKLRTKHALIIASVTIPFMVFVNNVQDRIVQTLFVSAYLVVILVAVLLIGWRGGRRRPDNDEI